MAQITTSELEEMIKKNIREKGFDDVNINEEDLKNLSERIKSAVNEDLKGQDKKEEAEENEEVVNVDISKDDNEESNLENPQSITQSQDDEVYKKEGELDERERVLAQKEEELKQKEEALKQKEEELKYKPEMPKVLEDMGSEKLFVFDMSKLSAGAENLSKLPMKYMDNPEEETTIKDVWLEKAKKKSEVYVVKFEKVGEVEFDPIEGTSNLINIKDVNGDKEITDFQNGLDPDATNDTPTNMIDTIEPIKDVSQPMTNDMGLEVNSGEYENIESKANVLNIPEENFEEILNSKLKEIIKSYINGQLVLGKKEND